MEKNRTGRDDERRLNFTHQQNWRKNFHFGWKDESSKKEEEGSTERRIGSGGREPGMEARQELSPT